MVMVSSFYMTNEQGGVYYVKLGGLACSVVYHLGHDKLLEIFEADHAILKALMIRKQYHV